MVDSVVVSGSLPDMFFEAISKNNLEASFILDAVLLLGYS